MEEVSIDVDSSDDEGDDDDSHQHQAPTLSTLAISTSTEMAGSTSSAISHSSIDDYLLDSQSPPRPLASSHNEDEDDYDAVAPLSTSSNDNGAAASPMQLPPSSTKKKARPASYLLAETPIRTNRRWLAASSNNMLSASGSSTAGGGSGGSSNINNNNGVVYATLSPLPTSSSLNSSTDGMRRPTISELPAQKRELNLYDGMPGGMALMTWKDHAELQLLELDTLQTLIDTETRYSSYLYVLVNSYLRSFIQHKLESTSTEVVTFLSSTIEIMYSINQDLLRNLRVAQEQKIEKPLMIGALLLNVVRIAHSQEHASEHEHTSSVITSFLVYHR